MIRQEDIDLIRANPLDYNIDQSPNKVPDIAAARSSGVHCFSLVTMLASHGGLLLPSDMQCYELFKDRDRCPTTPLTETMCAGTLVWLGRDSVSASTFVPAYNERGDLLNSRDGPAPHIAIFTGEFSVDGPLFLHAWYKEGKTTVWPLEKFLEFELTKRVHRTGEFVASSQTEIRTISGASHTTR